jgi:hypothetical protein
MVYSMGCIETEGGEHRGVSYKDSANQRAGNENSRQSKFKLIFFLLGFGSV